MADSLMAHPVVQEARAQVEETVAEVRRAAKIRRPAMAKFMQHVLKAQAELYRGHLAVVENMIEQLHRKEPAPKPAAAAAAASARTRGLVRRTSPAKAKGESK